MTQPSAEAYIMIHYNTDYQTATLAARYGDDDLWDTGNPKLIRKFLDRVDFFMKKRI